MREKRNINNVYVFYRISDNGFKSKMKPNYITKYNCLKNALYVFDKDNVYFKVYVDAVIDETNMMIHNLCDNRKNVEIINIDTRSNGFSFRRVYEDACKLDDNDLVYFLEDDYLHLQGSLENLIDAAKWNYTDYITLYDHPDKYANHQYNVNPLCNDMGEVTKVFKTNFRHWKITNSTTMTFAAFVDILKRDKEVFWEYTKTGYPYDFDIFKTLAKYHRYVSSPIPSLSTHGEIQFLAPFIDWHDVCGNKRCCVVIPTYKEKLEGDDERSFLRALEVFGKHRDIMVIAPDNISTEYYDQFKDKTFFTIAKVDKKHLSSIKEYSSFLCSKEFYKHFEKHYNYILIYQVDCWVFEDKLDYFMGLDYDWYGAPWPQHNDTVGNGGFSLRKVSKMLDITSKYEYKKDSLLGNEDTWFCQTHKNELNICDLDTACNFSMEVIRDRYLEKISTIPMGLHGKEMRKYFWDSDGTKFKEFKNKVLNK